MSNPNQLKMFILGGSGSSAIHRNISQIRKIKKVGRADKNFLHEAFITEKNFSHKKLQKMFVEEKTHQIIKTGLEMPEVQPKKFEMDESLNINDNLVKLLEQDRPYVITFNTAALWNFFSRNKIMHPVFVVRHPMHSYMSYIKPVRHPEFIHGMSEAEGVVWYANIYNKVCEEYFKCQELGLEPLFFKYEDIPRIVARPPREIDSKLIQRCFKNIISKNKQSTLQPKNERKLRELVANNFYKFYEGGW